MTDGEAYVNTSFLSEENSTAYTSSLIIRHRFIRLGVPIRSTSIKSFYSCFKNTMLVLGVERVDYFPKPTYQKILYLPQTSVVCFYCIFGYILVRATSRFLKI